MGSNSDLSDVIDEPVAPREKAAGARRAAAAAAVSLLPLLLCCSVGSVADPDPYVFGPPGYGSISQSFGSGSFYHKFKKIRKTLIPAVCDFFFGSVGFLCFWASWIRIHESEV